MPLSKENRPSVSGEWHRLCNDPKVHQTPKLILSYTFIEAGMVGVTAIKRVGSGSILLPFFFLLRLAIFGAPSPFNDQIQRIGTGNQLVERIGIQIAKTHA